MNRTIEVTAACSLVAMFAACGAGHGKQNASFMDASAVGNSAGPMDASVAMDGSGVVDASGAMKTSDVVDTSIFVDASVVRTSSDASPPIAGNDAASPPVTSAPLSLPLDFATVDVTNSPAPNSDPNDSFSFVGDHGPSGMALDGDGGVYVVWADWTPGERAIFFSAINSEAFTY